MEVCISHYFNLRYCTYLHPQTLEQVVKERKIKKGNSNVDDTQM